MNKKISRIITLYIKIILYQLYDKKASLINHALIYKEYNDDIRYLFRSSSLNYNI